MRCVPRLLSILALVFFKGIALAQEPPQLEFILQTKHIYSVTCLAPSHDGKHAVAGSGDNTAILWNATTGKKLQTLKGQTRDITSVALSGDGKHI